MTFQILKSKYLLTFSDQTVSWSRRESPDSLVRQDICSIWIQELMEFPFSAVYIKLLVCPEFSCCVWVPCKICLANILESALHSKWLESNIPYPSHQYSLSILKSSEILWGRTPRADNEQEVFILIHWTARPSGYLSVITISTTIWFKLLPQISVHLSIYR